MDQVQTKLDIAKANSHSPGHIFTRDVCFCKTCNTILTYSNPGKQNQILGLYNSQCKEV